MSEFDFHDNGWYPHDGEGKGMCTGPGCDCDERNYGSHGRPAKGSVSTFWAILSTIGGFIGAACVLTLLGVDTEDMSIIVYLILWVIIAAVLASFGEKRGL
jgi:hypothetical protein